jgi:tetratricopeptide (TPR) repeat protein
MSNTHTPIKVFYSYAHEDESYLKRLHTHLTMLRRAGLISAWYDRQIGPGTDWAQTIDTHLEQATIILLLVSPDFLASDYCYDIEMQRALQRHNADDAQVIPIILRPCDWSHAPFTSLQCLPRDGKAVTLWDNQDQAWDDVTTGIRQAIENHPTLPASTTPHSTLPPIWNIPHQRNPVFTGREKILQQIADTFQQGQITALSQTQAISGLGGIGKTQTVIEYAYQHHQDYEAVLWTLADTRESLISGYVAIAGLLKLPEKNEKDQTITLKAVLRWLTTHSKWLLILDNADNLTMAREFLPSAFSGHILLTTRAQAMGRLAHRIEVDTMPSDIGALFLLRRASLIAPAAPLEDAPASDIATAKEICAELGGLPLALDQAGAYIEETQCSLFDYKKIYGIRRADLLKVRGGLVDDHPKSVATTWSLSFEQLEQKNPAAADLLRFCAFLHPDAIPEEIITAGAGHLGPVLQPVAADPLLLNNAIAALGTYSLISRDATEKTLSIHRLVQVVLKDAMDEATQREWAQRAVLAVNEVFPEEMEFTKWSQCERCLPHAQTCVERIEQGNLTLLEAASLLFGIGWYLTDRGRYSEAESLYVRALAIREQQLGAEHPDTANSLNNLADLYKNQRKYELAEPLYKRALSIREQQLGPQHPDTATSLNNLALLYKKQGKYELAEPLYKRALSIREQQLGPLHPDTATSLHNLALLYKKQGKYKQAESLLQRAISIDEKAYGPEHPEFATDLNNLGNLYYEQGKVKEAEPLLQRALTIREQTLGPQHPKTALSLWWLAFLYHQQHKDKEAEPLYQRALTIYEHALGLDHPDTQSAREGYASLLRAMGREAEAIDVEKRDQDTPPAS